MTVYKITHYYSFLSDFYGVKTELTLHELNIRCAYLQLLYYELPLIKGAKDKLRENGSVALLKSVFDIEPIYEYQNYSQKLDLYDNWNDYCGGRLDDYMDEIRVIARSGVFKNLLNIMLINCRSSINRYLALAGEFELKNSADWLKAVNNNIIRLQQLVDGGAVDPEWNWRTIGEPSCTGRVYVHNSNKPDLPSIYAV
ncbi:hypothetical protein PT300_04680 [Enterobacteriaceae bacterium ESL0689]|nr:hypothetical protein [Enterobacteriaceae bacterium ESL0689]